LAGSYQPIPGDWVFPEKMAQPSKSKYIIKNNKHFKKIVFLWVSVNTEKFGQHYFLYFFGNNSRHGYIVLLVNCLISALKAARKKDCG
jgi:hypothetical protein